jgi:hypothetical protein
MYMLRTGHMVQPTSTKLQIGSTTDRMQPHALTTDNAVCPAVTQMEKLRL